MRLEVFKVLWLQTGNIFEMMAVSLPLFKLKKINFKKENHPKKNNKGIQDGMTQERSLLVAHHQSL